MIWSAVLDAPVELYLVAGKEAFIDCGHSLGGGSLVNELAPERKIVLEQSLRVKNPHVDDKLLIGQRYMSFIIFTNNIVVEDDTTYNDTISTSLFGPQKISQPIEHQLFSISGGHPSWYPTISLVHAASGTLHKSQPVMKNRQITPNHLARQRPASLAS